MAKAFEKYVHTLCVSSDEASREHFTVTITTPEVGRLEWL